MREKEFLPLVESRLGIGQLNDMQRLTMAAATESHELILLSPTGSGKTLAFALPMLKWLNPPASRLQALIIAPARELALQIFGVLREITPGYKVSVLYGGHKVEDEVNSLSVTPDIIIATPGRLLDHIKRGNIDAQTCRILVLDEFDKSLELGFEEEMSKIVKRLKNVSRTILTSATQATAIPEFLDMENARRLDFLPRDAVATRRRMHVYTVVSDNPDKLEALLELLRDLARKEGRIPRTIVFVNHRESAERVALYLKSHGVDASLYHGALDQRGRETALATFNNGSNPVLVATDLAARGLDIADVKNIIHYHQPLTEEAFIHRNGRTARVEARGDIFLLLGPEEDTKPYVSADSQYRVTPDAKGTLKGEYVTIAVGAGRKEKLSKGDILGFLTKEAGLEPDGIGKIDLFDHYALVAVKPEEAPAALAALQQGKVKGTRRRASLAGQI